MSGLKVESLQREFFYNGTRIPDPAPNLFVEQGGAIAEVLPENVLAKTDRMIAWWTPRRVRRMFSENAEGKAELHNGKLFPQPALVWRVALGDLKIRVLCENKRPSAETALAVAAWEQGFYESAFTHANV